MTLATDAMRRALAVYPIVDLGARLPAGTTFESIVAALLRGGATMIQLRDKADQTTRLLELAAHVRAWCEAASVPLVVNDRLDLALAAGAHGVHVGQRDASARDVLARARAANAPELFVGVSVRTDDEAARALGEGAGYLSASPVFDTPTKPDAEPGVGLRGLARLRVRFSSAPLVAIGGIHLGRVADVVAAGADGVAFVSAIDRDPEHAARAIAHEVACGVARRATVSTRRAHDASQASQHVGRDASEARHD